MKKLFTLLAAISLASAVRAEPIVRFETTTTINDARDFSPDGNLLASTVSQDGMTYLEIRETATGELVTRSPEPVHGTFHPGWYHDGSGLYTDALSRESILHWNGKSWEMMKVDGLRYGGTAGGRGNLSPDSTKLSLHTYAGDIAVVSLENGQLQDVEISERRSHVAAWSPDGRYLATGHDGVVILLDAETFREQRRYEGLSSKTYKTAVVNSLKWSPSGRFLAIGSLYGAGYLVEPDNAKGGVIDLRIGVDYASDLRWVPEAKPSWRNLWRKQQDILAYRGRTSGTNSENAEQNESSRYYQIWYDPEAGETLQKTELDCTGEKGVSTSVQTVPERGAVVFHCAKPDRERDVMVNSVIVVDPEGETQEYDLPLPIDVIEVSQDGRFAAIRESEADSPTISLWRLDDLLHRK
ncbi:WD40 repeat domain-containing protein [Rhodovulum sulfidophilum]|uniref:WD40 repeat domain-containing protein n=1 Tax=Rhodovulum sulfidophilum TaxID=35806 RepID=UPI0019280806|nr:WD40 repeat domain-containing protein [Rhodovulum sulfidophilum]MBL3587605.1 WD40 repeat domain-containing protein [Rhodovulum sulfidophilum]